MTSSSSSCTQNKNDNPIYFYDYHPAQADLLDEVIKGMKASPRVLAPKFFYDETGSKLFDAICKTKEYYPTRTEIDIIKNNLDDITKHIGDDCLLIEPGSGSSEKVRLMLDSINPKAYMPMDISKDYLRMAAEDIASEYPWLEVHAACVDYTQPFALPPCHTHARKVAFFPGSSIGNFDPEHAVDFLNHLAQMLRGEKEGGLLIGVDLKKDKQRLDAAYNDSDGYTAAFNQNLLNRISTELDAGFDPDNFSHRAFYNEELGRIEMHLISNEAHTVSIGEHHFKFEKDQSIHTESSYKYTIEEFQALAKKAGFVPVKVWTDPNKLFSVHYFKIQSA